MQIGLLALDVLVLAVAAWTTGRKVFWRNVAVPARLFDLHDLCDAAGAAACLYR